MILTLNPEPGEPLQQCLTVAAQLSYTISTVAGGPIFVDFRWDNRHFRCFYKRNEGYNALELDEYKKVIRSIKQGSQNSDWGEWITIT